MRPVLAAMLVLAAVPLAHGALGPIYGGELTVSVPVLPQSLEPARPEDASHRLALGLVHETLVRLDEGGRIEPRLARACESAASAREWRLDLEIDVRFHDDAPLTSDDALRSIRRFLDGESAAALVLRDSLAPDGVSAPDAGHLVLRFREALPEGPRALASPAAAITSASGAGAGPFLPTLTVPGQRLALTAFAGHVRGRPYLDRLTLVAQADAARRTADLAAGRVEIALDAGGAVPPASPSARLVLLLAADAPPCDSSEIRAALAVAAASADLAAFVGGTPLTPAAPPPPRRPLGDLRLTVAGDVPPAASQRLLAVLESAGARVAVDVRSPRDARRSLSPLRLILEAPEVRDAAVEARDRFLLAGGTGDGLLPLVRLPQLVASGPRVRGVEVTADTRVALEDAWLTP